MLGGNLSKPCLHVGFYDKMTVKKHNYVSCEGKGWCLGLTDLQWLRGCSCGMPPYPMTAQRTGLLVRNVGLQPPLHQRPLCSTSAYAIISWKVQ